MSTGSGLAIGGWFIDFVYACSVSVNTAAGVLHALPSLVIFGIIVGVVAIGLRK
jgi:ABC-type proline/glycine betaine transport system permease subunit